MTLPCIIKLAIPLLEEADEGGDPRARSDHHKGHRQVSRRAKGAVGPHAHMDLGSEAISEHLKNNESNYNNAEKPPWDHQSIN